MPILILVDKCENSATSDLSGTSGLAFKNRILAICTNYQDHYFHPTNLCAIPWPRPLPRLNKQQPMALDRIFLSNFRNHAETRLEGTARLNLLVGENGAGKTNILEALSLFAPGRGLRRASLPAMASRAEEHDEAEAGQNENEQSAFTISALFDPNGIWPDNGTTSDDSQKVRLGTGTDPQSPTRRKVHINGAPATALALGEWQSIAWLTPAMDRLFSDTATARRRYMDRLALALDPAHARAARNYETALRERNRLLSDDVSPDPTWMQSLEAQMAQHGMALAQGRLRLVAALSAELATLPDHPFARPALAYAAGGPDSEEALIEALARNRPRDRAAGRSLTGPHRDDLIVTMTGKNMPAADCSTGEQKAMLIALTLCHAELACGERPGLLLLDEVAAHLDPVRRDALFDRLRNGRSQVWLTGTELAPFASIESEASVWKVSGGNAKRI